MMIGRPHPARAAWANLAMLGSGAALLLLTGCASITTGSQQTLLVQTVNDLGPLEDASCELSSDKGRWSLQTPGAVTVALSYQDLLVRCEAAGHATAVMAVKSTTKPMAFGNVLAGGLIGATVDISSGAAYQYPGTLTIDLLRRDPAPGAAAAAPVQRQPQLLLAGDQLTYVVEDLFTRQQRMVTVNAPPPTLARPVDAGRHATALQPPRGGQLGDHDLLEPPGGWAPPHRLQGGQSWTVDYTAADAPPASRLSMSAQVMRREQLNTPAGRFNTWMIEYTGTAYRSGGAAPQAQTARMRVWVEGASGLVIRFESEVLGGMGSQPGRPSRERMELAGLARPAARAASKD